MERSGIPKYGGWILKNKRILAIIAIALVLRLLFIDVRQPGLDEPWTINAISKPYQQMMDIIVKEGRTPPLYYLIISSLFNITNNVFLLQLVSILSGAVTVFLVYLLAKEFFSIKLAHIAAFFMAIMPFGIFYSQALRTYSLTMMLFVLLLLLITKYTKNQRKAYLIYIFIVNVALLYNHYQGMAIVATEFFYFLHRRISYKEDLKKPLALALATALAYLPWLMVMLAQVGSTVGTSWVKVGLVESGYMAYKFFAGVNLSVAKNYFYLPIILLPLLAGLFLYVVYKIKNNFKSNGILAIFFFGPILVSLAISPVFAFLHYRFLSYLVSILAVLFAGSIKIKNNKWKILVVAISALWLLSDFIYFANVSNPIWPTLIGI